MKWALIRIGVATLAGVGAIALIGAAAVGMRGTARDNITAFACERGWISESTCYPDTMKHSIYDDIIADMVTKEQIEKEIAPILAEQERLKADKREWDKNIRASDREVQKAFIIGCERDKLALMRDGKDVSSLDCRKGSAIR